MEEHRLSGDSLFVPSIVGIDDSYTGGSNRWSQQLAANHKDHASAFETLPLLCWCFWLLVESSTPDFGLFYQVPMNSGALFPVTNTIDTYVYRGLIELGTITRSAAAGMYQSIVGFILVLTANLIVRKIDRDNALF